jgi:hypothetical protein
VAGAAAVVFLGLLFIKNPSAGAEAQEDETHATMPDPLSTPARWRLTSLCLQQEGAREGGRAGIRPVGTWRSRVGTAAGRFVLRKKTGAGGEIGHRPQPGKRVLSDKYRPFRLRVRLSDLYQALDGKSKTDPTEEILGG